MAARRGNPDKLVRNEQRTPRERRENAQKAGKKSGEVRREKRKLREILEILLQRPAEGGDGTNAEAMTVALFNKALAGDTKAFELIRDTIGEKPVEQREDKLDGKLEISWQD